MKLRLLLCLTVLVSLYIVSVAVAAPTATVNVQVGGSIGDRFAPEQTVINVGDTVVWSNAGGYHNVVADDGSFVGPEPDGAPSVLAWEYTFTFDTPGTYTYYCTPHKEIGMVGTIIVQEVLTSIPIYLPLVQRPAEAEG